MVRRKDLLFLLPIIILPYGILFVYDLPPNMGIQMQGAATHEHFKHERWTDDKGNRSNSNILQIRVTQRAPASPKASVVSLEPSPVLLPELQRLKLAANASGPGENGEPVEVNPDSLSPDQRRLYDEGWQRGRYNQYVGDLISIRRSLPDVRHPNCSIIQYPSDLPQCSVVIIFHNEALSTLLRTVYSAIDRSPPHLLKEILLIDDYSEYDDLKAPLDQYASLYLPKVRIIRTTQREGSIRARLLGAKEATAEILVYLDSHCECTPGWLEPLLVEIYKSKNILSAALIDVINADTMAYEPGGGPGVVGGFNWNLEFGWLNMEDEIRGNYEKNWEIEARRSPTTGGGLFAVHRQYFFDVGSYDEGMDVWGRDNLELSFRWWMCGGQVMQIPCSRVAHVFRTDMPDYQPKDAPGGWAAKNGVRLAEVWMDEFKSYFYFHSRGKQADPGDISSRIDLRKNLNCSSFAWYMDTIFPEKTNPFKVVRAGMIRSIPVGLCLVAISIDKVFEIQECSERLAVAEYWLLTSNGQITRDGLCYDYDGEIVRVQTCLLEMRDRQTWEYKENSLVHQASGLCIEVTESVASNPVDPINPVAMRPCNGLDPQRWMWKEQPRHRWQELYR